MINKANFDISCDFLILLDYLCIAFTLDWTIKICNATSQYNCIHNWKYMYLYFLVYQFCLIA